MGGPVPAPAPPHALELSVARADSGLRLLAGSATHTGLVRRNNEDALLSLVPEDETQLLGRGALFAIADGVGGQAAGEVASRAAVDALGAEYYSPRAPHQIEAALRAAMHAANLRVFSLASGPDEGLRSMQTTLTALVLAGRQAYVGHAGDSRVYLLRDGVLTQLTGDHSEAAELLRLRLITPEQAYTHPRRSVLTRALGASQLVRPDFQRAPIQAGDRFLICTDGLWGEVPHDALLPELTATGRDPAEVCRRLVALACDAGGGDNVSLHVVDVLDPGPAAPGPPPGRIARLLAGLRGG